MFRRAVPLSERFAGRFSLPDKFKGGRIERFINFCKNVATDYKEATHDIIKGAKNKPFKATVYGSTAMTLYYLSLTRPNEQSFRDAYIRMHHDLTILPESTRNKLSQIHRNLLTLRHYLRNLKFMF